MSFERVQKYIIDVIVESHKGRKDFKELVARVPVTGRYNAVELSGEIALYYQNVLKKTVQVDYYKEEKAPSLSDFDTVSV